MDIRQIRYLVSAVEGGSLSAAAKTQYVTVQAVSKAITELESELNVQLLTRGNHGVFPTAVGAALYKRGRRILNDFDDLVDFTASFPADRSSDRLTICLCSPQFTNDDLMLRNIAKLIERFTGLKTSIISGDGEQTLDALTSHAVDVIATIGDFSSPDTDVITIGSLPSGVVLSTDHPLAQAPTIRIADLAEYPVLYAERFDSFNRSILRTYLGHGLRSKVLEYHEGFDVDEFFQQQLGAIFTVHVPNLKLSNPHTVNKPIDSADSVPIPLCLVTLKSYKTPAYLTLAKNVEVIFRGGRIL